MIKYIEVDTLIRKYIDTDIKKFSNSDVKIVLENLKQNILRCAYSQDLECIEIIQCKDCGMDFPWCRKFRDELGGNGFCPYGVEVQKGV